MSVGYLDLVRGQRPGVGPPAVDVEVLLEVGVKELEDEVEDGLAVLGGLLDGEEAVGVGWNGPLGCAHSSRRAKSPYAPPAPWQLGLTSSAPTDRVVKYLPNLRSFRLSDDDDG